MGKSLSTCTVCHDPIEEEEEHNVNSIEAPYTFIEQIQEDYPVLAKMLGENDGTLIYHDDCSDPIKDLLPSNEEVNETLEELRSQETEECPNCTVILYNDQDTCPNCGEEKKEVNLENVDSN